MIRFAEMLKNSLNIDPEHQARVEERLARRASGVDNMGPRQGKFRMSEARHEKRARKAHAKRQQKKATARYRRQQWAQFYDRQNALGMAKVWHLTHPDVIAGELIYPPIWHNVRAKMQAAAKTMAEREEISVETAFYNIEESFRELLESEGIDV